MPRRVKAILPAGAEKRLILSLFAIDPVENRRHGRVPPGAIEGLRKRGAFGMKIPKKYGGLGFDQREYQHNR